MQEPNSKDQRPHKKKKAASVCQRINCIPEIQNKRLGMIADREHVGGKNDFIIQMVFNCSGVTWKRKTLDAVFSKKSVCLSA